MLMMKAQPFIKGHQYGFTLPEFILALSFGSLVMLSAAQSYPLLRRHINFLYQNHRLDQAMRQVIFIIEKDLRRAGFCNGECPDKPVTVTHKKGEPSDSCIIVAYDLNRNGHWEKAGHSQEPEYFGYRLHKGFLEKSRSTVDCQEGHWSKLFDPQEIVVTHFLIRQWKESTGKSLFLIQLAAHWKKHTEVRRQINWICHGYNA